MIKSRKSGSNINAKTSIEAKRAEARAIVAELSGGFQFNYAVA